MRENIMKKILSVLLVLTMVLSLGLTFAASAADYTHPEYDPFTDKLLPEANMEHPFDEVIAKGTTTVLFELSKVKYNYTYNANGESTTPTIIKKVAEDGTENVVEKVTYVQAVDDEGKGKVDNEGKPVMVLDGTYKYYVELPTVTVDGTMYVVVETWAQIASLARAGFGTQFTELNLVFKHDITPQVMTKLASDDKLVTENELEYIFAPVSEGITNIPAMNAVGTDRVLTIDGNGYGLTNFSMHAAASGKEGLFGSVNNNLTLKNIHVGTKAAPIEFTFKGESGLITSWMDRTPTLIVDNMMLYMKGTGEGNGHMGILVGNKSTTDNAARYSVDNSVFAFELVRNNYSSGETGLLGQAQPGAEVSNTDIFCRMIVGAGNNGVIAGNGGSSKGNAYDITNVNAYGYAYSTNNISLVMGWGSSPCNFKNVNNYVNMVANGGSAAGFVGNYGAAQTHTYENCNNYGDITSISTNGWSFAGGFEGRAQGIVVMTNCANYGNVTSKGYSGGFFAESQAAGGAKSFTNCTNGSAENPVTIQGASNVGGFVGSANTAAGFTFKNCSNFAAIIGTDNIGGFTGWTENVPVTIDNCVSVLAAMGGNNISGFVAKSNGGQQTVNPNQAKDLTDANDADGNGIIDTNEVTKIVVTNSKTVVYATQTKYVAPLVGTYYQNVTVTADDGTTSKIAVEWNALDTDASVENASNVDGEGISASAIMDMAAIEALIGADAANGLNAVNIGYTAAHTDDGNFVRVFGTTAVLPNEYAGFTFSYTYTDENGVLTEAPERTYWCSEVYNGLEALEYSYQEEIPATEEGAEPTYKTVEPFGGFNACKVAGGYIWALTFEDVPAGDVTITVKAFADGVESEEITIVLRDGNVYTAPVEGETTEG